MPYKTILVVLGVNDFQDDIKDAIVSGQAIGAHLSVVVAAMAAPPPFGASAEEISAVWLEERGGDIAKLAEQTRHVEEQLASSGLSFDVQDLYTEGAWADEAIAERALYVDLTLVGRRAARDRDLCPRIIGGALFQAPAPLLLNPTDQPAEFTPRTVLIAWNSRREAARAVQQALPILQRAGEVRLVLVDPLAKASPGGEDPGADIAAYLARQGVPVTAETVMSRGRPVQDILKQRAAEMGADLIVMGAYSHSRLRERIFGGVTRSMIETCSRPLFLGH
ncbi:universal stress protein (plasmid) [Rhizobium sp. YTUHZ044]|uniref:universal stress protein n=1 Tax=Rhizobium sp. YTUHZ044 TaxID=2962678 RepID=UPI003DA9DADD